MSVFDVSRGEVGSGYDVVASHRYLVDVQRQ
jgi:hypothetical protein